MGASSLHRHRVQTIALILMWVGSIEIVASFLAKMLFQFEIYSTPYFFMALLVGVLLFVVSRMI